jgi:hypothetical protein
VFVAVFRCGLCSVTANSRMIFAFSRDGALPGSALWRGFSPATVELHRISTGSPEAARTARFTGPHRQGDEAKVHELENELRADAIG